MIFSNSNFINRSAKHLRNGIEKKKIIILIKSNDGKRVDEAFGIQIV